jgi:hypothetical protein
MPVTKSWTFQRLLLRKNYNPIVLEYFGDLSPADEDFNSGRKALKEGCLIRPKDGQQMALHKMQFFYNVVLEAHDKPAIYGMPITFFKENFTTLPQIQCFWKERDDIAKANNRRPIYAQCSLRYNGDISSKSDITSLGNKIKSIFGTPQHHFTKGRIKFSYWDASEGIYLRCFASTESDAEKVFKAMIDIKTGVTYQSKHLVSGEKPHFDWTPSDTETIAGQSVKSPKEQLSGEVYFTHAELKHRKLKEDIVIYAAVPQCRKQSFI